MPHETGMTASHPPRWTTYAVWWHVYPLGFLDAEKSSTAAGQITHRLTALESWLDYAVELGVSGVALGPIFASSTHGYDTIDHFRIDPRLGDDADFDSLVQAAHARGLKVMLDGVFNHVGRKFPAFEQALAEGPEGPSSSWFRLSWPAEGAAPPDYATFEGHRQLVALNHDEPNVAEYVVRVMHHWLERGADGWRLDAAYAVPAGFWSRVLGEVGSNHPNAYFVGEMIHGDYAVFVRKTGLHAVTQYELWKAIRSSLNDRNLFELEWALKRHNLFLKEFAPLTFIGNHDVTRVASSLTDRRHLPHALVVLFSCGGTPSIYAGDEQAFTGIKEDRPGGDDAVRPPFPGSPAELAGDGWPVYRLHQDLVGLRRRHPWLHRAQTTTRHLTRDQLTYEARYGDDALVVALNIGDSPAHQAAPFGSTVCAGRAMLHRAGQHDAHVDLPPFGWAILSVQDPDDGPAMPP